MAKRPAALTKKKRALITGIKGQDGAYLARHLLDQGYEVYGADRRRVDPADWRLREVGAYDGLKFVSMDLLEQTNIMRVIEKVAPDEIYNLAAQSFVGASFDQPMLTSDVDGLGVLRLLESIRTIKPDTKFYQASTSEMFGKVQAVPQSETTPFYPRSPYGVAKLFGHWMTVNYRESYDLYACAGILFNHESPLRGIEFVTRKITDGVARIALGQRHTLVLGNLDAERDWGFAGDYVRAIHQMLQMETPRDYVVATGETHSVKSFVEAACAAAELPLQWEGKGVTMKGRHATSGSVIVEVSDEFYRPAEVDQLLGDPSKAKRELGWEPSVTFEHLVEMMVRRDMERVRGEA